jgi:hypothetical protein
MAITRRQFMWMSLGALGAATLSFERFGLLQALAHEQGLQGAGFASFSSAATMPVI